MSNIKISEMPSATSVSGSDIIPIVQSGVSKKATKNLLNSYSTTEQVVGKWIDGKPIYQKTYYFSFDGTSQTGEKVIDISDLNYSVITKISGTTKQVSANTYWRDMIQAYAYSGTSVSEYSGAFVMDNSLKFRYRGMGLLDVYITLEYTKTTD